MANDPDTTILMDTTPGVESLELPLREIRGLDVSIDIPLLQGEFDVRQLSLPIPVAIWAVDVPGRRLQALSPSAASLYGIPLSELAARPQLLFECMLDEDGRSWAGFLLDLDAEGQTSRVFRIRRGDGEERWVFGRASLVRDEDGAPLRIDGVVQDVNEQVVARAIAGIAGPESMLLADLMPGMVFEIDLDGYVRHANGNALEAFGYTVDDLAGGLHAFELVAPEYRADLDDYFKRTLAGHPASRREFVLRRRNGSELFGLGQATAVLRGDEVVGLRGVLLDVTDVKRAEFDQQYRQDRLARQKVAFERIAMDPLLHEGDLNDALSRICEIAAEALAAERVVYSELDPSAECLRTTCPCGTSEPAEGLARICARQYPEYYKAVTGSLVVDVACARTDPRTRELAEAHLVPRGVTSYLAAAVRLDGEVSGVVACEHVGPARTWNAEETAFLVAVAEQVSHQIERSSRRRTERDLEMFKAIADHASYGVIVTDTAGRMLYLNNAYAAMHQVRSEDVLGGHYSVFHTAEQVAEIESHNATLRDDGGYLAREIWHRRADGTVFPTLMNTSVVREASGRARFIAATAYDVSDRKRQDEALQEERRRLKTLIASLPGMVFRIRNEPDWPVEYLSDGSFELTGWRPEELTGNREVRHMDVVHPDDQPMVWAAMEEALANNRPYEVEYRITTRAGRIKWVWEQGLGVYENGELVAAEGFVTDIDERIRQQQDLRLKQFTLDHVNDAVLWITEDGRIIDANATACSIYGCSQARLRELDIFELTPEYTRDTWSDQWRHLREFGRLRKENVHQLADGRVVPVEVSANLLHFEDRELMCALVRDITARKRAEEHIRELNRGLEQRVSDRTRQLSESRERYRLLIESLRDRYIFYSLDRHGEFSYVSPSIVSVLGLGGDRFSVADLNGIVTEEQMEFLVEHTTEALRGHEQPHFEITARHGDGTQRVFEVLQVPVLDGEGRVVSVEGIAHDITSHKQNLDMIQEQQDQLLHAEKMAALGRMVAGVTHEVNTPVGLGVTAASHLQGRLATLTGAYEAQTMKRSDLESFLSEADETVRIILGNLDKAVELIQGFKGVAVDQSDEAVRRFDLKRYLEELILNLRPELKRTQHEVRLDCPEGIEVDSTPGALSQVVTNLVMNSLIHGFADRDRGLIRIEAAVEGDAVRIVYRDDGAGMTEEVRRQMFEPFFTTRRGEGGSGLGMHVVYTSITHSLGGTIACESSPGHGVRFEIEFPLSHRSRHDDA